MILGVGLLGYWEEKDEKKSDIWQKRVCGDHETREKVREIKRIFCFPSVELTGKKREIPVLESLFTELQAIEMTASSWTYCLLVMSLQSVPGLRIRWWISSLASLNCSQGSLASLNCSQGSLASLSCSQGSQHPGALSAPHTICWLAGSQASEVGVGTRTAGVTVHARFPVV